MKRMLSAILAAMLSAACFGGCAGSDKEKVDTVCVWTSDGGGKSTWAKLTDDFNRTVGKQKKVKIEWTTFSGEYSSVVGEAYEKGSLPDIVALSEKQTIDFAKSGDILPLEDFTGGSNFVQRYEAITPNRIKIIDGKVYGVSSTSNVAGLIYNKDLFKKAGIVDANGEPVPPKTFAQMREYAKRITDKKKNIYGYSYPMNFSSMYSVTNPVSTSARIKYDVKSTTADMSEFKPMLQTLLDMKSDGSLFPGAKTLDNDTSRMYFAEGKIGMMAGISWDVAVLTTQFVANCDWAVAPFPTFDGTMKYPAWHDLSGSYAITKNAKKIDDEKIMAVYEFMYSRDTRMALYENNVRISCMTDVMEHADESKLLPQFKQFSQIFDESYRADTLIPVATGGLPSVWKDVWEGEITLDEMIDNWNKMESSVLAKKIKSGEITLINTERKVTHT